MSDHGNPILIDGVFYQKVLIAAGVSGDPASPTNPLPVQPAGIVSDANSSATPLGADGFFPGTAIEITPKGTVSVNVFSDVASAADGLNIQQSSNGINWDHDDKYTVPAGKGKNYAINPHSKWLKVDYANGSNPQTVFRLQTIVKANSLPSSHRIKDNIVDEDDARLVINIPKVQTNNEDTYANVSVQNPFPTDGDSAYGKDLDLSRIITTGWTGDVSDLFGDLTLGMVNSLGTSPKTLTIFFQRTIITDSMGLGAETGNFSNVKITALLSGGATFVLFDGSADITLRTSQTIQFIPLGLVGIEIEFSTTNTVNLTNIVIIKSISTVSRLQAISELDDSVENINSFRGSLNINQALVHKVGVSEHAKQNLDGVTTLDVAASIGDTLINVASTTNFAIGSLVIMKGANIERGHFHIIGLNAGISLTLNRPLDNDHITGTTIQEINIGMNVVGSLAAPISFKIEPPADERWQITRIMITMLDQTAMDDSKFGGIPALTNGAVLRTFTSGIMRTFTHWQTNGDLKDDMNDVEYSTKAPAGFFGLNGRWTFTRAEFVADLDGATGDYFEVLIQDTLTSLDDFEIKGQGRLFGG